MTGPAFKKISIEEYLRQEEDRPVRHDYIDGFVYAQAGASRAHNILATNITAALHGPARKTGCQVYQSDMKVRVSPTRYHYPDVVVSCTPGKNDDYTEEKPCLIVEVLSENELGQSTRMVDQNYKAEYYQSIPSLQAYLMVDSRSRSAALWRRQEAGWEYQEVVESVTLPCMNMALSLEDVYEGVNL